MVYFAAGECKTLREKGRGVSFPVSCHNEKKVAEDGINQMSVPPP
jgi:hypothetical protein